MPYSKVLNTASSVSEAALQPLQNKGSILARLTIRLRLTIIVVLLLVPLAALSVFFELQSQKDISFSTREREGITYMKAVWPIYRSLIEGGAGLPAVGVTVEDLVKLAEVSASYDTSLGTAVASKAFQDSLKAARWPVPSLASDTQRKAAIDAGKDLITQIGNGSNLVLDPELDTYYLMDIIVLRNVEALQAVIDFQGFVEATRVSRNFDVQRRSRFLQSIGRLRSIVENIEASAKTASIKNESGFVKKQISIPLDKMLESSQYLLENSSRLELLVLSNDITSIVGMIQESALDALKLIDNVNILQNSSIFAIDHLISERIYNLQYWRWASHGFTLSFIVISIISTIFVSSTIIRSLFNLRKSVLAIASGEGANDIADVGARNEIGGLARSILKLRNAVETTLKDRHASEVIALTQQGHHKTMAEIADRLRARVSHAVAALRQVSDQVVLASGLLSGNAGATQVHASDMSVTLRSSTESVNYVASALEQMSSSINEIARQTEEAATITVAASDHVSSTRTLVKRLAFAADSIGEIGARVSGIAAQTNLLALNATIEAARAGDAGRGFAVVAAEVKALANETGRATDEISHKINEIRSASSEVGATIGEIINVIARITEISAVIAVAVQQQTAATDEIGVSMRHAADESNQAANDLKEVVTMAIDTGDRSANLDHLAKQLADQAEALDRDMSAFLNELAA
jgi:methyl-accepting chemotaxis protein